MVDRKQNLVFFFDLFFLRGGCLLIDYVIFIWIRFSVFFMKGFGFWSICFVLGNGDGIYVEFDVYVWFFDFFGQG